MRLESELVENIRVAASLHDVGKIQVPLEILRKDGGLTDEEFEIMRSHAAKGSEMVAALDSPEITAMVRHHHERMDGRGYPDRLTGDEIPLGAKIIAVADTFDAICSTRSYRRACRHRKALAILKKEAGGQLDPSVVEAFSKYYSGRSAPELWASFTTIPQRVLASIGRSLESGGTAGVLQGTATVATVIAIAHAPLVAPVRGTAQPDTRRVAVVRDAGTVESGSQPLIADAVTASGSKRSNSIVGGDGSADPLAPGGVLELLNPERRSDPGGPSSGDAVASAPNTAGGESSDGGSNDGGSRGGGSNGGGGGSGGSTGAVDDATDEATDTASDTADDAGDAVDDTVDDATDAIDDATGGGGGGAGDTVDDTVDDTTDTVGDTTDDAGDTVDDTVDDTTDTVDDTVGGIGPPPI